MFAGVFFAAAAALGGADGPPPGDPEQVVQAYYAAIDRKDYATAYRLWDHEGTASGKSLAGFSKGFAQTAHSRVTTATPVEGDAGMSQRWVEVPVDVHATLSNGKRQHFRGRYTLHRVVEGVGASRASERWHIASATLKPVR